jgi:hypothetical protein
MSLKTNSNMIDFKISAIDRLAVLDINQYNTSINELTRRVRTMYTCTDNLTLSNK